jgi:anti-sigma B factor antagonist
MIAPDQRGEAAAGSALQDPRLRITVSEREGTVVVAFAGDIDLAVGDRVASALAGAIDDGRDPVVADLRECTFLGSTGVRLLLQAGAAAAERGTTLSLLIGDSPARRTISLVSAGGGLDILG